MLYLIFLAPDALSTASARTYIHLIRKTFSHAHRPGPVFPMLQNVLSAERKKSIKFIERVIADMEVFLSLLVNIS